MAKAKKLPSGSWTVQVFAGMEGKKRIYKNFTRPTKREAEFAAAQYALERKDRKNGRITLQEALDRYIDSKDQVLSPSTIREYRKMAKRDLENLRPLKLDDLTQELIQKEINREAETHSPKTVRNLHGLLSAALKMFLPELSLHTTLPKRTKPEYITPSEADIKKLLSLVAGTKMEIPVLLAAAGSLRRSEVAALEQSDVSDLGVTIQRAMVQNADKEWVIKQPKTTAGYRFAPLPPQIVAKLRACGEGRITDLNPEQITKGLHRVLKANGLPLFRFHDLRHYYASALHALGVPDKYIMLYGGWESQDVLHNVYEHTLAEQRGATEEKVVNFFAGVMQDEMQDKKKNG